MDTMLTIPCHWDIAVLAEILKNNSTVGRIPVGEVYGTLAKSPTGHGRAPSSVPAVTREGALDFRERVAVAGLGFTYLLNAPFSFGDDSSRDEVERYVRWVVEVMKPNGLTIASHELMQFIRGRHPEVAINISTVAGVSTRDQLIGFADVWPKRLIVHHDVNRNFADLRNIMAEAAKRGIEVELMATESCLRRCPSRVAHYAHLAHSNPDSPFHTTCNVRKLTYPRELLKANFIRPEDIGMYEEMGVRIFKITGRSKRASWLPEVVEAYSSRRYAGNMIRLMGIDPSMNAEEWIYINNLALSGFLEFFPQTGVEEDEDSYCESWIQRLYEAGDFVVRDGSMYEVNESGSLVCCSPGEKVASLARPK